MTQPIFIYTLNADGLPEDVENLADDELTEGKWIDGLAPVDIENFFGDITIEEDDLSEYLTNSLAVIKTTEDTSGEAVGLPIDLEHMRGESAGWIVDMRMNDSGDVIEFKPKWTKLGVEMISSGKFRFFSATFNQREKVVIGGALTNWPATRDEKERHKLTPVELSQKGSIKEVANIIFDKIKNLVGPSTPGIDNQPIDEPQTPDGDIQPKETTMVALDSLSTDERADLEKAALKKVTDEMKDKGITGDLSEIAGLSDFGKELSSMVKDQIASEVASIRENAKHEMVLQMARLTHENDIKELSKKWISGTAEFPRGIPVEQEEMISFLTGLNDVQYKAAVSIFAGIQEFGTTAFDEIGHDKRNAQQLKKLPEKYQAELDKGSLKIADLGSATLGLGDPKQYDLSKWEDK